MIRSVNQALLLLAAAVSGSLLYFYLDPSYSKIFPPCPFFTITGFACPGCGSQRAFHDLLHGNISAAMNHNILFVLFLPLVLYSAVVTVNNLLGFKKMGQRLFNSAFFARSVLVVVLSFWILRNIPVFPFSWLAPW